MRGQNEDVLSKKEKSCIERFADHHQQSMHSNTPGAGHHHHDMCAVLPEDRHCRFRKKGADAKHKNQKSCVDRESNPGLVLGRHQCCHYTTNAPLFRRALPPSHQQTRTLELDRGRGQQKKIRLAHGGDRTHNLPLRRRTPFHWATRADYIDDVSTRVRLAARQLHEAGKSNEACKAGFPNVPLQSQWLQP